MPETDPTTEPPGDALALAETIAAEPAIAGEAIAAMDPVPPAESLEAGIASVFATILAEDAPPAPPPPQAGDEGHDALWALDAPLALPTADNAFEDDRKPWILRMPAFASADADDDGGPADEDRDSEPGVITPLRRPAEEIPPEIRQIHELLTELDRLWSHAA